MKYLVFADFHFSGRDSQFIDDEYFYPAKTYIKTKIFEEALQNFPKQDKKICIISGDIFHEKDYVHASSLKLFCHVISTFTDWTFYLLVGNHDVSDKSKSPISLLSFLKELPGLNHVHILESGEYEIINQRILLLPWCKDIEETLSEIVENNPQVNVLISHLGVNEAQLSSGKCGVDKITFQSLSQQFKTIVLGHYHKPQELSNDKSQLVYIGSCIQENWGEAGEDKRYVIYDDETNDIKFIENKNYPKFMVHIAETVDEVKNVLKGHDSFNHLKIKTNTVEVKDYCTANDILCVLNRVKSDAQELLRTIDSDGQNIYNEYLKLQDVNDQETEKYMEVLRKIQT